MVEPTVELTGKLNMPGQPIPQAHRIVIPCPTGMLRDGQVGQIGDSMSPKRPIVACGRVGQWMLIVGPHSIQNMLMDVIAGIAEQENVNVLDGGNFFEAFRVTWQLRKDPEAFSRINLRRAVSCHQMLSLLENTPSIASPFVVLDLLNTFYDVSVKFRERKQLLRGCLENLGRLEKYAGGVVSVSPPRWAKKEAVELLKIVEEAASEPYRIEIVIPSPQLKRLY
jgi:hypothetical protein